MKLQISDGRISIRPFMKKDINGLYRAVRDSVDEVSPWLPWCHPDYSIEESRSWVLSRKSAWDSGSDYSFVIIDAVDERVLGGTGINQLNRQHNFANLGYWVRTGETGRGIATSATIMTAKFGFEKLCLRRLEIIAAMDNRASLRVAEKAGARREGFLRKRLLINGIYHDVVLYSLLPEDLLK